MNFLEQWAMTGPPKRPDEPQVSRRKRNPLELSPWNVVVTQCSLVSSFNDTGNPDPGIDGSPKDNVVGPLLKEQFREVGSCLQFWQHNCDQHVQLPGAPNGSIKKGTVYLLLGHHV
ncbi:hypothetical protein TNCV_1227051 [Trichonephila clavipes]|nr:hypothetical protein TNCV_1227051 [Trichonephila clavipes]